MGKVIIREGGVKMNEVQNTTKTSITDEGQQVIGIEKVQIVDKTSQELSLKIKIYNEAKQENTGIIKIYIRDMNSIYAASIPVLYTFETVQLGAQEEKTIIIRLYAEAFMIVDEKGDRYRDSNEFEIYIYIEDSYNKRQSVKKKVQFQSIDEEELFM